MPGLGYVLLYGGFGLISVLFEFMPTTFYTPVIGLILLISIMAILLSGYLMNENKAHRLALIKDELKETYGKVNIEELVVADTQDPLTEREKEVLQLILEGKTNKEIGESMYIGERTVKFHLGNIYSKYGVKGRSELVSVLLKIRAKA